MKELFSVSTLIVEGEYILRILLAAVCGALIGLEREKRAKNAGVRTHVMVALSAALLMVVSKYGFFDVLSYDSIDIDASRIASTAVSAIGFIGVGVIFVKKEGAVGVTTAAGLWATLAMGLSVGAGLYFTGICFTLLIIIFQLLFHRKRFISPTVTVGIINVALSENIHGTEDLQKIIKEEGLTIRSVSISQDEKGELNLKARILFPKELELNEMVEKIEKIGELKHIDLIPV